MSSPPATPSTQIVEPAPAVAPVVHTPVAANVAPQGRRDPKVRDPIRVGHLIARHFDAYGNFWAGVNAKVQLDKLAAGEVTSLDDEEQLFEDVKIVTFANEISPHVGRLIDEASPEDLEFYNKHVNTGQTEQRNTDTKKIKNLVKDSFNITPADNHPFLPFNPPLIARNKSDRGFHHPAIAKLLVEGDVVWDTLNATEQAFYLAPGNELPPSIFRAYLYENYLSNADDLTIGLYRSQLMILVMVICHMNVSSLKDVGRSTQPRKLLTYQTIVYWATLLLFALSSHGRIDEFDYQTYYRIQIRFFEDPESREFTEDLIVFYDRILYPGSANYSTQRGESDESSLAKIQRQRRAKKAAAGIPLPPTPPSSVPRVRPTAPPPPPPPVNNPQTPIQAPPVPIINTFRVIASNVAKDAANRALADPHLSSAGDLATEESLSAPNTSPSPTTSIRPRPKPRATTSTPIIPDVPRATRTSAKRPLADATNKPAKKSKATTKAAGKKGKGKGKGIAKGKGKGRKQAAVVEDEEEEASESESELSELEASD
ncbi:hypothetical protein SISNIDRAFT_491881 [Sistotremastrum niveocremeum HHB9708]|uniref:Uncharacterized protein n=1 Tax=Sistotremastrum niveocremeum HHB9708 TaxID=1314777 RepID=A0A164MAI4_9AGAM|nr:hypothetical protein SISNIDRAFT_491881 [Sistotremastrum niveocremeum HHB9708]